jgi:hypothetical protein
VELDVGLRKHSNWAIHSPAKDAKRWGEDSFEGDGEEAKDEKRNYVKLAGGQLLAWFVVDSRIVSGEMVYKSSTRNHKQTPLTLVCHWPKNAVEKDTNFLGQAIHAEGCEGYGYIPIEMTPKEIGKLRLVRTIEAATPDEASCEVREWLYESKKAADLGPFRTADFW